MEATVGIMGFGKYRGAPASDVPMDYLEYVMETFPSPPRVVIQELERRSKLSGRDAIRAAAAIGSYVFLRASKRKPRPRRRRPGKASAPSGAEERRQVALEKVAAMQRGVRITGERFESERAKWEAAGGDQSACPFDGGCDEVIGVLRDMARNG